jgi:hypothetical protein
MKHCLFSVEPMDTIKWLLSYWQLLTNLLFCITFLEVCSLMTERSRHHIRESRKAFPTFRAHTASCTAGTGGSFSGDKAAGGVKLTTHLHFWLGYIDETSRCVYRGPWQMLRSLANTSTTHSGNIKQDVAIFRRHVRLHCRRDIVVNKIELKLRKYGWYSQGHDIR